MPYIGNTIRAADDYRLIDDISSGFNGSETSFALQVAGSAPVPFPKSPQQVLISVNGVIQEPDPSGSSGFNLVGTNIVFSSAPTNGHAFFGIIYATADYLNAGGNFPAGSLGAPSITFIGDENSGLYRKSGGSVGFVSDATEIANFDSNGITISSGNIIIPDSIIHGGDTNTKIRFPAADTISAETAGTEALRITSTGRLGINETNPGYKLVVGGDIGVGFTTPNDAARQLNFNVNRGSAGDTLANINWQWNSKFVAQIRGIAGDDTTNKDDAELGFFTSAANSLVERLRITRTGDIGVGTSDPKTQFHIQQSAVTNAPSRSAALYLENNANCELQFVGNSSNDCQLRFGTSNNSFLGAIEYELDNANMEFYTGGSERMRILGNGKIGIGTSNPSQTLDITGSNSVGIARFVNTASSFSNDNYTVFIDSSAHTSNMTSAGAFAVDVNGGRAITINGFGRVGIGTSSPTDKLHVVGDVEFTVGTDVFDIMSTGSGSKHPLRLLNSDASAGNEVGIQFGAANNVVGASIQGIAESDFTSSANRDGGLGFTTRLDGTLSEAMRIDSSGRLLIRGQAAFTSTTKDHRLQVKAQNTGDALALIGRNGDHSCTLSFLQNDASTNMGAVLGNSSLFSLRSHSQLGFQSNGANERMRLDTSGRLLHGVTASVDVGSTAAAKTQIHSVNSVLQLAIAGYGNNSGGAIFALGHSRGTGVGDATGALINNDEIGTIRFAGSDGTDMENTAAFITGLVDGSVSGNSVPGELALGVNNGAGSNANCILIRSDFDIFLGGASGANRMFQSNSKGFVYDHDGGGNHPFIGVQHATKTTGAAAYISFQSQTSERGKIAESNSGNNVTYNTSSDYRLKQDEVLISDGITRLKQLKPYQFKWKDNLEYGYVDGFFAHEVGEVIKGSATGSKDEVVTQEGLDNGTYNKNRSVGDMVAQGLDYSRLTPLLTAALQEAVAKIETLETEVAALKAA